MPQEPWEARTSPGSRGRRRRRRPERRRRLHDLRAHHKVLEPPREELQRVRRRERRRDAGGGEPQKARPQHEQRHDAQRGAEEQAGGERRQVGAPGRATCACPYPEDGRTATRSLPLGGLGCRSGGRGRRRRRRWRLRGGAEAVLEDRQQHRGGRPCTESPRSSAFRAQSAKECFFTVCFTHSSRGVGASRREVVWRRARAAECNAGV